MVWTVNNRGKKTIQTVREKKKENRLRVSLDDEEKLKSEREEANPKKVKQTEDLNINIHCYQIIKGMGIMIRDCIKMIRTACKI